MSRLVVAAFAALAVAAVGAAVVVRARAAAPGSGAPPLSAVEAGPADAGPPLGASAKSVVGPVEREVQGHWEPLAPGATLGRSERVRTGPRGKAVLELTGGTLIEVDQSTALSIDQVSELLRRLKLEKGRVVAEQKARGVTLQVENPRGAVASIDAPARFTVRETGDVFVVATETGKVNLRAAGAAVDVVAGQLATAEGGGAPSAPEQVPVEVLLKVAAEVASDVERCLVRANVGRGAEVRVADAPAPVGADGTVSAEVPGTAGTRVRVEVTDLSGRTRVEEVSCVAAAVKVETVDKIRWK